MPVASVLHDYYQALYAHFGPCNWWPGDNPFEVVVGVVLTQSTNWRNVEKALLNLKAKVELTPKALWEMHPAELEAAIRPSGFYTLKAKRLRNVLEFFAREAGTETPPADAGLAFLRGRDAGELRRGLLSVRGIGPESADSILLYALGLPSFVIDAYTYRMLHRHGFVEEEAGYAEMQELFHVALPEDASLYNEYHALIVRLGQFFCRKSRPDCKACPLGPFMDYYSNS